MNPMMAGLGGQKMSSSDGAGKLNHSLARRLFLLLGTEKKT